MQRAYAHGEADTDKEATLTRMESFSVTDPHLDAPDGATIVDDEHGWITRVGSTWRSATQAEINAVELTFEAAMTTARSRLCPFCVHKFPTVWGVWRHLDNWHYGQPLWPALDEALRKEVL